MDKFVKGVGVAIIAIALVFVVAVISGTLLWAIYPHIHALFPTAATKGIIAQDLKWWDAVCVTWIFGILIKGSYSTKSKD